ncbi:RecB family exonuclease-like protein [Nitzschia inconspicua]|uniref:RecB family exonuclease-like protein n=1 Tax=Nitzschia inconspicua TaxID=303405 RepID=A0A9K3PCA4_9STRA|nr:RecB family exonuclease-like protein [Nitzschia inconspicua]
MMAMASRSTLFSRPRNCGDVMAFSLRTFARRGISCGNRDDFGSCYHYSTFSRSGLSMATPDMSIDTMVNQSSSSNSSSSADRETADQPLMMHPSDFGEIPFPTHLSPSSAMEFRECPQSFLFQYLYNLKQPTSPVLAKGSMCHKALEHIFDLEPTDRTLENLHNMLRVHWGEQRLKDEYKVLFEDDNGMRDLQAEREWGQSALQLLENYYRSEDPRTVVRPNPYKREVWVNANLTVDPSLGVSSATEKSLHDAANVTSAPETFKVRGIVDRIDMVKWSSQQVALRIVDYKTGKAPTLKYSASMNQQIFEKNFWQLKVYALLLREMAVAKSKTKPSNSGSGNDGSSMELRYLKLHYLTSEKGRAKVWEMDLGETQQIRDETLQEVHQDLAKIWTDIRSLVATQDPKSFTHCDRSFCYCHKCREKFVPGTLYERMKPSP